MSLTTLCDLLIMIFVWGLILAVRLPSTVRNISMRLREFAEKVTTWSAPNIIGFDASANEHIGVMQMQSILGSIIGPPADIE